MNEFDAIWKSSANNYWSATYPIVIGSGIVLLTCLAFIRNKILRISLQILAMFFCTVASIAASSLAINEKWRIRHEWTSQHWDNLTAEQQDIAIADGANIVMGPYLYGIEAFLFLLFFGCLIELIRFGLSQKGNLNRQSSSVGRSAKPSPIETE